MTKHYVNLGIAAATPRGLVVPNVKDADLLDLVGLARALQDLVDTARAGRTTPADMAGGTITITNVGVFGVDGGTPIINPGESAILCMGRAVAKPWVVEGEVRVRQVMQLTLSFDHRLVDGALGSQVLAVGRPLPRGPGGRACPRLTGHRARGSSRRGRVSSTRRDGSSRPVPTRSPAARRSTTGSTPTTSRGRCATCAS